MSVLADALRWEASFQMWVQHEPARKVGSAAPDTPWRRAIWARAPLAIRVGQAERWLRIARRRRAA